MLPGRVCAVAVTAVAVVANVTVYLALVLAVPSRFLAIGLNDFRDFYLSSASAKPSLAVWACVVPAGTMQHPILFGRDSWMRSERRSYTTLPRQPQLPHHLP